MFFFYQFKYIFPGRTLFSSRWGGGVYAPPHTHTSATLLFEMLFKRISEGKKSNVIIWVILDSEMLISNLSKNPMKNVQSFQTNEMLVVAFIGQNAARDIFHFFHRAPECVTIGKEHRSFLFLLPIQFRSFSPPFYRLQEDRQPSERESFRDAILRTE